MPAFHTSPCYDNLPGIWDRAHFVDLMAGLFPEISDGGGYALDVGCGPGFTKPQLEVRGYRWTGIDISGLGASTLSDSHFLPFPDQTFSLILSLAAFEHMRKPWQVARELSRVAQPGALFCGTTAFLEPQHVGSYFHMSHLGVQSFLEEGGFEVLYIWPGWHVLEALAWFNLVEGAGRRRNLYPPVQRIGRLGASAMHSLRAWRLGLVDGDATKETVDRLRFSGSIGFAARHRETRL